jgi:hypothetical protein
MITTKGLLVPAMQFATCYPDAGCRGSVVSGGEKGAAPVAWFSVSRRDRQRDQYRSRAGRVLPDGRHVHNFAVMEELLGLDDPCLEGAGAVAAMICHAGFSLPITVQELSWPTS